MSLTIYGIPASRAIRPLWAACELGLSFRHVSLPYEGGATRTADFLALNPNGHIPVVVDERPEAPGGRVVVWESMAMRCISTVSASASASAITQKLQRRASASSAGVAGVMRRPSATPWWRAT